jgi:hypothetical protein
VDDGGSLLVGAWRTRHPETSKGCRRVGVSGSANGWPRPASPPSRSGPRPHPWPRRRAGSRPPPRPRCGRSHPRSRSPHRSPPGPRPVVPAGHRSGYRRHGDLPVSAWSWGTPCASWHRRWQIRHSPVLTASSQLPYQPAAIPASNIDRRVWSWLSVSARLSRRTIDGGLNGWLHHLRTDRLVGGGGGGCGVGDCQQPSRTRSGRGGDKVSRCG